MKRDGGARFPLPVRLRPVGLGEEDERRLDTRADGLGRLGVREVELEEDRAYGAGFVVAGTAALVAGSLTGDAVVGGLARMAATEPAIRDVWEIPRRCYRRRRATIGYGLVMIAGAWLAGRSAWATAVRRNLAPYLRDPALAFGALAALAAVVVLRWARTPAMPNPVTAVFLLAFLALGFEGLRRLTAAEFPSARSTRWVSPGGRHTADRGGRILVLRTSRRGRCRPR